LITQEYLHLQDLLQESSQQLNNHQKLSPQHTTQSQARVMANQQPTVQELQALILALQAQVQALQNAALAIQAAPVAAATLLVFADTPQMLGLNDLIDYSTKRDQLIYDHGFAALDDKALTNGFNMIPNETVIFVEAFQCHANAVGWTKGTKQITTFNNCDGKSINIIKNYGQIDKATLKTACE
jgi:hypothetical protein